MPESARVGVGGRFGRVVKGAPEAANGVKIHFHRLYLPRAVFEPDRSTGPLIRPDRVSSPGFRAVGTSNPRVCARRGPIPARTAAIAACLGELCAPRRPRVALSARSHVYLCFEAVFSARRPLVVRVDPAAARVGRVGPSDKREAC